MPLLTEIQPESVPEKEHQQSSYGQEKVGELSQPNISTNGTQRSACSGHQE